MAQEITVTLVGDSILDNLSYVHRVGPDVASQLDWKLKRKYGEQARCVNCAIDGDVISGVVARQLRSVPPTTTHVVVSCGGNDGLGLLTYAVSGPLALLETLFRFRREIRAKYSTMLDHVLREHRRVAVCCIYYPLFGSWYMQKIACVGVWLANRIIKQEASKRGLPVIDLAHVFSNKHDYANPIEPGCPGGDKLTENILDVLETFPFDEPNRTTRVYAARRYTDVPRDVPRIDRRGRVEAEVGVGERLRANDEFRN